MLLGCSQGSYVVCVFSGCRRMGTIYSKGSNKGKAAAALKEQPLVLLVLLVLLEYH